MKVNPGGNVDPNEVIGRDNLIKQVWETLERQSVLLVAGRRMGKTSVVKKMQAEALSGKVPFYRDLENIRSPIEFVERVYQDILPYLKKRNRIAAKVNELLQRFAGIEISGIKFPQKALPHWKPLLESILQNLADNQEDSDSVILFLDEFPLMLQNIIHDHEESVAMDVLDTLRSLRQTHSNLRMVYTGSIGLHHVSSKLRASGHANDATNDMRIIEVPPLDVDSAKYLAEKLIVGEGLECANLEETTEAIATKVDCVAYYIHHVISSVKDQGNTVNVKLVNKVVENALVDPQSSWHLHHFQKRIPEYYGQEQALIALTILDEIAANETIKFSKLQSNLVIQLNNQSHTNPLASKIVNKDKETLLNIISLLQEDHYLIQDTKGNYHFRFPLIHRWWKLNRGL